MSRAESPHHLLAEIYEAGTDPDLWSPLLGGLAEYLGATACALTAHDFGPGAGTICQAWGYDPDYVRSYAERHAACNVWLWDESRYRPAGTVLTGRQLVPDVELVGSEFYNDWLRPQRLHHRLCGVVWRGEDSVVYIAAMRPQAKQAFGAGEAARLGPLLPHLRRAVLLHRRVALLQMERDAARQALDLLPTAVLLVDEAGAVLMANRRAEEMLAAGDGLMVRAGAVRAVNQDEADRLRRAITGAARAAPCGPDAAPDGALSVSRRSGARPLQVQVSPVRATRSLPGLGRSAAAVFVVDPDLPIEVDGERLCQLYGLTRVESNLARLIAEGRTVEEAAAALRIAVNTARAYLKRVFDKTGVRRQAELVRLLLVGPAQLRSC